MVDRAKSEETRLRQPADTTEHEVLIFESNRSFYNVFPFVNFTSSIYTIEIVKGKLNSIRFVLSY